MEYLKVRNFLVLDDAFIEIRDINLFIGPQANGKSVIARLIYLIKNYLNNEFFDSTVNEVGKRELCKKLLSEFELIFPKYSWETQVFHIEYSIEGYSISINSSKKADGKCSPSVEFSKNLWDMRKRLSKTIQRLSNIQTDKKGIARNNSIFSSYSILDDAKEKVFLTAAEKKLQENTIFIPAGRSFFANVNESIFSLLASGAFEFDQVFSDFGSRYSTAKKFINSGRSRVSRKETNAQIEIDQYIKKILKGNYHFESNKDWIKTESAKIAVANSSSGQQESLPLLIMLSFWPFALGPEGATFFIEEPEAHLFPSAQKNIIELLCFIYNITNKKHKFFLTTHSPYVLSAVNIMVQRGNAYSIHPDKVDRNLCIFYKDVSAYKINGGTAIEIRDDENKLIAAEIIDEVSIEFDREFTQLLDIIYQ